MPGFWERLPSRWKGGDDVKVKILVDSTSDIPENYMKEYDIDVIPLYVIWKDGTQEKDTYKEEEKREFYKRLLESPEVPDTSQPTVQDFIEKYEQYKSEGYDEVIVITISTAMSGTYNSAMLAKNQVEIPVHVFDSKRASSVVGLIARRARLLLDEGKTPKEVVEILKERLEMGDYQAVFYVTNFEYLVKGGRISKFQGFLGSMLKFRIGVYIKEDGSMEPFGKARGLNRANDMIVKKLMDLGYKEGEKINLLMVTAGADEDAKALCEKMKEVFDVQLCDFTLTGKVITKHVAPGMVGIGVERIR